MNLIEESQINKQSRMFAQKVARSIVEIQPNVNNAVDAVVLIECLGYRKETLAQYGFADYHALANYVCKFLDMYEMREKSAEYYNKTFSMEIPKISKRLEESIGFLFPSLGAIALLFLTGVSLWMAIGFPIKTTTAFVTGALLGVVITAGPLQLFDRYFLHYHEQLNKCEMNRIMRRTYCLIGILLSIAIGIIYVIGYADKISFHLLSLTVISMVTMSLHRASYMIIYALKKVGTIIVAHSFAFGVLLVTYYFGQQLIPSGITRYFVGLVFAFIVLSIFSIYQHHKLSKFPMETSEGEKPHFYHETGVTKNTIRSRYSVQVWESLPYSLYAIFLFFMMFSDRILSWFYNPILLKGNFGLPIAFNTTYHIGADMALIVLLPASTIQYFLMASIHIKQNNICISTPICKTDSVTAFIRSLYLKLVIFSMTASIVTAVLLNLIVPSIMTHSGVTQTSIQILQIASVANVFMCLFMANGVFMVWLNKTKFLLIIILISSTIIITYGIFSDHAKLQNLTVGYLASLVFAAISSLIYTNKIIKRAARIVFARSF